LIVTFWFAGSCASAVPAEAAMEGLAAPVLVIELGVALVEAGGVVELDDEQAAAARGRTNADIMPAIRQYLFIHSLQME
jgi:hypothetical protein